MTTFHSLRRLFNPRSIALIGASSRPESAGHLLLRNLTGGSFEGAIFPVNPRGEPILGQRAYASLDDLPETADLAIIATPAATVPDLIEQCGRRGIGNALVVSAGFQEAGKEGIALHRKLVRAGKRARVRILGPGSLGFIRPSIGLNACYTRQSAIPGRLAFVSQSGALCASVLDWAGREALGFSHFIAIGGMADLDFHDLIDYLGEDPHTSAILLYMESLNDARRFVSAARSIGKRKPIIVLRAGRSAEGAAAVSSHTGALSSDDALYDAVFKRAGIARVTTLNGLFHAAQALATQSAPKNNRLIVITNAGGPGIIATDAHIERGGRLATLSPSVLARLNQRLPRQWSGSNPVDLLGAADPTRYRFAFETCSEEANADGLLLLLAPQAATDARSIGQALAQVERPPSLTVIAAFMGAADVAEGAAALKRAGIPVFDSPEVAVECFNAIAQYGRSQAILAETPESIPAEFEPRADANRILLERVRAAGRLRLDEQEALSFIANYGISAVPNRLARSPEEASELAANLGFPVALKIASPDIPRKTDAQGVVLDVRSRQSATKAYQSILDAAHRANPQARIHGVLVETMVSKSTELFIGSRKDPLFGPALYFGMGGIGVEVYRDIAIAIPPLNMAMARRMIDDTRISRMLKGYRGIPPVDLNALQFLLYRFSYMVADFPELLEVDINPLAVDEKGLIALDAKISLDPAKPDRSGRRYPHLIVSPYPKHWEKRIETSDGRPVLLRAIRPEDESMEAELFRSMSEETQRFRFFQIIRDITHEELVRYTQIDYDREIAVIAEIEENGCKNMAGVARVIADPYNESAEFAVVVTDRFQGLGLGAALTDHVLLLARRRQLALVYAHFLPDNRTMRRILIRRGFEVVEEEDVMKAVKRFSRHRRQTSHQRL